MIYTKKGVKGFYSGSTPNFTRMIVKNIYRYPLMIALPSKASERFEYLQRNKWATKMITALTIAVVESYILCPIERFKVLFITHNREAHKISY